MGKQVYYWHRLSSGKITALQLVTRLHTEPCLDIQWDRYILKWTLPNTRPLQHQLHRFATVFTSHFLLLDDMYRSNNVPREKYSDNISVS